MILEKLTIPFTWGSLESGSNNFCVFTHTHIHTGILWVDDAQQNQ